MLIPTKPLDAALTAASRFSGGRSPNEAYSKVKLYDQGGTLRISAGNGCGRIEVNSGIECSSCAAVLEFSQLHAAIRASNLGEVEITFGDGVIIKAGKSKITLPIFDLPWPAPIATIREGVTVDTSEFASAPSKLAFISSTKEMSFAQGQRLYSKDGTLQVLASSGRVTGGVMLPCDGNVDVVIPHESMDAMAMALKKFGEKSTVFRQLDGAVTMCSGPVTMLLPTTSGKLPWPREAFDKVVGPIEQWIVPRQEVSDFLAQVAIFTTEFCTGVDIRPTGAGLEMEFNGLHDEGTQGTFSSGTCSIVIDGKASGSPVIVRHEAFRKMIDQCSDDYILKGSEKGVAVISGNFFAVHSGITRMSNK